MLEIHFRNADKYSKIYLHLLQIRKELDDIKSKNEQIKAKVRGSSINRKEFGNVLYFVATRIRQLSKRKERRHIPQTGKEYPRLNNMEFVVIIIQYLFLLLFMY